MFIYFVEYYRLTTDEALALLEELDESGEIVMGFPEPAVQSDGDSDFSDEEAGQSGKLNRQMLEAPAEIVMDNEEDDPEEPELPKSTKKSRQKNSTLGEEKSKLSSRFIRR